MADYGQSASTLATSMAQAGETPQTVSSALETNARGSLPEGQQPATGLVKAWGAGMSTAVAPFLLPSEATVGSILGAGAISGAANLSNQIASGGPVSTTDVLVSTGIGAVTQGRGFLFTEAAGMAGAYGSAKLQGKDPLPAIISAGAGVAGGALIGKGFNRLQPIVTPQYKIPKLTGTVAESVGSEFIGNKTQKFIDKIRNENGGKK
ncbi:hypothetical protein HVC08_002264 [Salmonella enterica]|nr:hypothetical protein [Salmonella enterica]